MNYIDIGCFTVINKLNSPAFYLSQGLSRDFILPFPVRKACIGEEELNDKDTCLIISLYPQKHVIMVNKSSD